MGAVSPCRIPYDFRYLRQLPEHGFQVTPHGRHVTPTGRWVDPLGTKWPSGQRGGFLSGLCHHAAYFTISAIHGSCPNMDSR